MDYTESARQYIAEAEKKLAELKSSLLNTHFKKEPIHMNAVEFALSKVVEDTDVASKRFKAEMNRQSQ